jgi:lipid-A-disaccharide synthase
MRVLVVAGEASGDRALAMVVGELARRGPIEVAGLGGDALSACGARLIAHVRDLAGMGVVEVVGRGRAIARAIVGGGGLLAEARRTRPDVALLASWSSANARIGARLRAMGIPVVWIAPPEIWAWGAWRARSLARAADRLVVTLPFEVALWRAAGADARYLGHPIASLPRPPREEARRALGIAEDATAVALLPGSRRAEIEKLTPPMLAALARLRRARGEQGAALDARVLVAGSLPDEVARALSEACARAGVPRVAVDPARGAIEHLAAFDAALVASGTASLECALAGAPPVVTYAAHPLTFALAKLLVRTDVIALPNVLLARAGERPPFAEIVATRPDPDALAAALGEALAGPSRPALDAACARVGAALTVELDGAPGGFEARVADLVHAIARRV